MAIMWVKEPSVTTQHRQNYLYVELQTGQKMQNSQLYVCEICQLCNL